MTRRTARGAAAGALAIFVAAALLVAAVARGPLAGTPRPDAATHAPDRAVADSFLALARSGTARFADPAVASREGFRRVGVEFPEMGEHWVSLARVMADTLDAAAPSVLTYARVRGRLTLVGVGYTDIMAAGETPRRFAHGHWHEHNGSIAEESLARPAAGAPAGGDPLRVAILHAWAWLPNPAGPFVTDNPALPFARHGLARADGGDARLASALALAAGTTDYFELASRPASDPASRDDAARALIARHAVAAESVLAGAGDALDARRRDALLARWDALWRDVERAAPARARAAARLRASGDVHAHH